jgi:hypothetical protein
MKRRVLMFLTAFLCSIGLWLASNSSLQGQEAPKAKMVAIRLDNTELDLHFRLALRCGDAILPLGTAFPRVVTEMNPVRVVDLCIDGQFVFVAENGNVGAGPTRVFVDMDRSEMGPLGGILFCLTNKRIGYFMYRSAQMDFSCAEAAERIKGVVPPTSIGR